MNTISEQIELLGKGLYTAIPDVLTLKSIPTASELEYVGAEDFDKTMVEKILPASVEEKINFYDLFEADYRWLCRALRMLSYGPYYTTDRILCSDCGKISWGEYQVDLRTVGCKPLPEGFKNPFVIDKDRFMDQKHSVEICIPTIKMILDGAKDKAFVNADGSKNRELARLCYTIRSIAGKQSVTQVEVKMIIQQQFTAADYLILKETATEMSDFGVRAAGTAQCPKCGSRDATFIAFADDRFFRPTGGNLLSWKADRDRGETADAAGAETETV